MIDEIVLDIDGLEIPVSVIRKRVKNLNLRVRADGTVTLSIPQHLPLARAHEFLERRGNWIAERVHRNIERRPSLDFVGELPDRIPLWGKLVPLDSVQANPGQGASGQGAGGQAIPGQGAGGQSAGGQAIPGQTAVNRSISGQSVSGQTTPGQPTPGQTTSRSNRPRRALPHRSAARAARCGRAHGGPHRRPCSALERPHHEDALGFVHAENGCDPHQRPTGRLSARVPRVRGGARARPPAGAQPQRPLPRPTR